MSNNRIHLALFNHPESLVLKEAKSSRFIRISLMAVGVVLLSLGITRLLVQFPGINTIGAGFLTAGGLVPIGLGIAVKGMRHQNAPQVAHEIETPPVGYSLDTVIETIRRARAQGLKVSLFLGRANNQALPSEERTEWFSLDIMRDEDHDPSHHLEMNFNNLEAMRRLHNLFDKVVVDWSTMHLFDADLASPWRTLHSLLAPGRDSELIVCADPFITEVHDVEHVVIDSTRHRIRMRLDQAPQRDHFNQQLREQTRQHLLENYFNEVELRECRHPYRREAPQYATWYFFAKNPKNRL